MAGLAAGLGLTVAAGLSGCVGAPPTVDTTLTCDVEIPRQLLVDAPPEIKEVKNSKDLSDLLQNYRSYGWTCYTAILAIQRYIDRLEVEELETD